MYLLGCSFHLFTIRSALIAHLRFLISGPITCGVAFLVDTSTQQTIYAGVVTAVATDLHMCAPPNRRQRMLLLLSLCCGCTNAMRTVFAIVQFAVENDAPDDDAHTLVCAPCASNRATAAQLMCALHTQPLCVRVRMHNACACVCVFVCA